MKTKLVNEIKKIIRKTPSIEFMIENSMFDNKAPFLIKRRRQKENVPFISYTLVGYVDNSGHRKCFKFDDSFSNLGERKLRQIKKALLSIEEWIDEHSY